MATTTPHKPSVASRPSPRQDLPQNVAPVPQPSPPNPTLVPSSSTAGFFQSPPQLLNQLADDIALQRSLDLFLPPPLASSLTPTLSAFASLVLTKQVLHWVADAEHNPPYLRTWDTWGVRRDELITSEGWRQLQDLGIKEGMVAIGYENAHGQYSRVHHFLKYHLWCGSSAWVNCPSLMTDGVATLLRRQLSGGKLRERERGVLRSAYERVVSREIGRAWTTGQWMTERQGGSDVSQTETVAVFDPQGRSKATGTDGQPLGDWSISGFKWFSSATDSSMVIMLARTGKGVSAFYAPMRRTLPGGKDSMGYETGLNGISIQRLKQKLGTRALPTAELELRGVRAYLIGEEGKGTKEIATVLNIARIHNAVTAVGFWGRGLGVARAFARCRMVGLKPLSGKASHVRTLAGMHAEYRANVLFAMFVSALLGVAEQAEHAAFDSACSGRVEATAAIPDPRVAEHLLRLLTPAVKGLTAKKAIAGLAECMESLGGVGYLENEDMQFNIARLYRDANVLSIWEGTTDMMAHDVMRVVYGKTGGQILGAMEGWVKELLKEEEMERQCGIVRGWWTTLSAMWRDCDREEVEMRSREGMEMLGNVVMGALLILDARRDGDEVARQVAESWIDQKAGNLRVENWKEQMARDHAIVFGEDVGEVKARL
jgi:alkylation response protein AidB-like acyl-CoA dehydrogenase